MIKQPVSANTKRVYYPIETKRSTEPNIIKNENFSRTEKVRERDIDVLRRQNQQLKQREQIYIDKLMKLQEGLENQHSQFIKLQELYTQLFQSYKQKEIQIIELETKFRESDRYRQTERQIDQDKIKDNFVSSDSKVRHYSFREQQWAAKYEQQEAKEQNLKVLMGQWANKQKELNDYIEGLQKKLANITENYERVLQEVATLRSKQKSSTLRAAVSQKTIQQLQQWQQKTENERETRLKFQYENQFLKNRNNDLETQRQELQKLLAYKQKQISKLREEKIKIHRQSSQKFIQRSPGKVVHSKVTTQLNQQIKQEEKINQVILNSSTDSNKNQYFSFSRERHDQSIDSQLPSFPPQLQIESLITQHKK